MRFSRLIIVCCVLLLAQNAVSAQTTSASPEPRKIDEFGVINCEYEMARLDNFLIALQNEPPAMGYIIYYEGRRYGTKRPRVAEAETRAARMKPYLIDQRGLSPERLVMINGGFRESWTAELWIVPGGATAPVATPTLRRRDIKFRRGRVTRREFRLQCMV
jgi:hypothetical protein